MATIEISEHCKKIIFDTAEGILRENPGRTRFSELWAVMRKEHPELATLHKNFVSIKGFRTEIRAIMCKWPKRPNSKIGFEHIKKGKDIDSKDAGNWFWYRENDSKEMPPPSTIHTKEADY